MRRKVFDKLASVGGVVVVIVLAVAGSLLLVGYNFANNYVHTQLSEQQITFPSAAAFAHPDGQEITKSMIPSVSQYAGQELLTGQQAEVYANDFIAVHLSEMPYGGVYSKLSAAYLADPKDTQLAAARQNSFMGTTLRGLLLEAYAFSEIGVVMLWGAIASFVLAAIMSMLVGLGFWHARRTTEEEQMVAANAAVAAS
jgi:hypothetical protein